MLDGGTTLPLCPHGMDSDPEFQLNEEANPKLIINLGQLLFWYVYPDFAPAITIVGFPRDTTLWTAWR